MKQNNNEKQTLLRNFKPTVIVFLVLYFGVLLCNLYLHFNPEKIEFIPFDPDIYGSFSDWAMVLVTAVTAYFIWGTLNSQLELSKIERERFYRSIQPRFSFSTDKDYSEKNRFKKLRLQIKLFDNDLKSLKFIHLDRLGVYTFDGTFKWKPSVSEDTGSHIGSYFFEICHRTYGKSDQAIGFINDFYFLMSYKNYLGVPYLSMIRFSDALGSPWFETMSIERFEDEHEANKYFKTNYQKFIKDGSLLPFNVL